MNNKVELSLEEIMEDIIELTFDGFVVVDKSAHISLISETYCEFLGVIKEDVIGKHVADVIENTRMHIVVETGKAEFNEAQEIKGNYMIATRVPIIRRGEIIGAIGTVVFKNVDELFKLHNALIAMERTLESYKGRLKLENSSTYSFTDIIGNSFVIQDTKRLAEKAAETDSNVLLLGESGTGKEIFAHAIHSSSNRANGPFVKINCAAIPRELLESELFGYEAGSFTGARKNGKAGKFEIAHHGTIFLDEIGDMPLYMQVKLLRVIQEREVERVGSSKHRKVDVRIIAATNKNLEEMVKNKSFREDLYYRLNVMSISIPPLRVRDGDIQLISNNFLERIGRRFNKACSGITSGAMNKLLAYHWPGNIRELQNVVERAYNLIDNGEAIDRKHLPKEISGWIEYKEIRPLEETMREIEIKALQEAIESCRGNKSKVAKLLNISRATLYEKMNKYNMLK